MWSKATYFFAALKLAFPLEGKGDRGAVDEVSHVEFNVFPVTAVMFQENLLPVIESTSFSAKAVPRSGSPPDFRTLRPQGEAV